MKHHKLPADILNFARSLRGSQTDAENLLWLLLRNRRLAGIKFRRQHPLAGYILDFYCHEAKLVIELDGGGHNEDATRDYDRQRTIELEGAGLMVIRFWNNDVLTNIEGVLGIIYQQVLERSESPSPPAPLPEGEGRQSFLPDGEGHSLPSPPGRGWPTGRVRTESVRKPDKGEHIHNKTLP